MKNENAFSLFSASGGDQDDINALSNAFAIKSFDYIDIAREERLKMIMLRWTLLQELLAEQGPNH
jgi:hypothetical protein